MNRLKINDLLVEGYCKALRQQGYVRQAETCEKIYERQRGEIIANENFTD